MSETLLFSQIPTPESSSMPKNDYITGERIVNGQRGHSNIEVLPFSVRVLSKGAVFCATLRPVTLHIIA